MNVKKCERCKIPYCCFFEKERGPYLSSQEALIITKHIGGKTLSDLLIRYNKNFRIRTKPYPEIGENPLKNVWEDFGNYPCIFLKRRLVGYDLLYRCEIYYIRSLACRMYYCVD